MAESNGAPTFANGLAGINPDDEVLRLDSTIRSGIEPRVPAVRIKPVDGFAQGPVVLVRVPQSWSSPHMVTFRSLSRFYSRTNSGKFQMDVMQIRQAFLFSEAIPERMRRFRDDRLAKVVAGETPVPLIPGGPMVLHLLPVSSFAQAISLDAAVVRPQPVPPIATFGGFSERLNLDGLVTYSGQTGGPSAGYTQLFRNGCLEALYIVLLQSDEATRRMVSPTYEHDLIRVLPQYLALLKQLGIIPSILVFLSLFGTRGYTMGVQDRMYRVPHVIDCDALLLPEILLEGFDQKPEVFMKPIFDTVWQSAGFARSWNYNDAGQWAPRA